MKSCYEHGLTPDIEALMDELTAALAAGDNDAATALYATVPVPDEMIS